MIDPSIVGTQLEEVSFPIELSKVMEIAKALHDDHPAYRDATAAREAGFQAVPAPLTVSVLASHWDPRGAIGVALDLGMDLPRVLHGETTWDYLAPVVAGDHLTAQRLVSDVAEREGKRGGKMTFVGLETTYTNQRHETVMRQRDVLIEREG